MTIDEILRDQDGVIARRQATAAGLSAAAIKHRLATGAWLPVRRAVFRSAAHPETDRGRVWADALWLGDGADLMDRALLRGRVTVASLRAAHWSSLGRRSSHAAGDALVLAARGARFEAERRLHRRLRQDGVGGWVADLSVGLAGYGEAILDLAFPGQRVVVEVDGWAHHRDVDDFRRDRRRQNALVLAGWTVVRVTWHDLVANPERVMGWIRDALDRDRRNCSFLVP